MNIIIKRIKSLISAVALFCCTWQISMAAEYGKSQRINVNADSYLCAVGSIIANFDYSSAFSDEFLMDNFRERHANISKFMDEMGPFEMNISNNAKDSILVLPGAEIVVPANRKIVRFDADNVSRSDHALYSQNYKYNFRLGNRVYVTDAYNDVDFTKTKKTDNFLLPDYSFAQFEWFVNKTLQWIFIVEGNDIEQIYVRYVISDGAFSPIYDVVNRRFIVDSPGPKDEL